MRQGEVGVLSQAKACWNGLSGGYAMRRALVLAVGTAICTFGFTQAMAAPQPAVKAKVAAVAKAPVDDPTIRKPGWTMRNAMGQPDLSGYWSNATLTPLT